MSFKWIMYLQCDMCVVFEVDCVSASKVNMCKALFTRTDTERHQDSARSSLNIVPLVDGYTMGSRPILANKVPVAIGTMLKLERAEFRYRYV